MYLNAASGIAFSNFTNAGLRTTGQASETYFRKTSTVFEDLGTSGADALNLGINTAFHYTPALPERRAPMQFFDVHNFETNLNYAVATGALADSLLGQLGALVDSFRFRINTKRLDVVDGWGTCKIPGGTFNVLREKRSTQTETSIDVHTFLGWVDLSSFLGGGGSGLLGQIGKDTITTLHFFSATEKEEIAIVTLNNAGNTAQSVRFKHIPVSTSTSDVSGQKPGFSVAPNPLNLWCDLRFENFQQGDYLVIISDLKGAVVFQKSFFLQTNTLSISLDELPSGLFFIQLFDKNGAQLGTQKLIKQR